MKNSQHFSATSRENKNGKSKCPIAAESVDVNQNQILINERMYYDLLDRAAHEIYLFDSETFKYFYVNKVAIENLGYTLIEMLKRSPLDLLTKYDAELFKKILASLLSGKVQKQTFKTFYKRNDGSSYPVEIHLQLTDFNNKKAVLATVIDTTTRNENKQKQEDLHKKISNVEQSYQNLITNSLVGILLYDPHSGAFLDANPAFLDTFGYNASELKQLSIDDFIPEHLQGQREVNLEKLQKYGKITYETERLHKNGSLIPVESTVSISVKSDASTIILAVVKDITDRRKKEEEIKRNYRELKQFAYLAAHDLKSPVGNIERLLSMLENEEGVKEHSIDLFNKIISSVKQMQNTIKSLNEVIEVKNNLDLKAETVKFQTVLEGVITSLSDSIKKKGVKIDADFRLCKTVKFSPVHLQSILQNLITNSIKYGMDNEPPIIHISTRKENDTICLVVKDNGKGIDMNTYGHKLFELFQRFHLEVDGKGIGLHLVNAIVENNGGHIDIKSQPNNGAEFAVYLKQ